MNSDIWVDAARPIVNAAKALDTERSPASSDFGFFSKMEQSNTRAWHSGGPGSSITFLWSIIRNKGNAA